MKIKLYYLAGLGFVVGGLIVPVGGALDNTGLLVFGFSILTIALLLFACSMFWRG